MFAPALYVYQQSQGIQHISKDQGQGFVFVPALTQAAGSSTPPLYLVATDSTHAGMRTHTHTHTQTDTHMHI